MKIKAVKLMREIREQMAREIEGMSLAEEQEYFRRHDRSPKSSPEKSQGKNKDRGEETSLTS